MSHANTTTKPGRRTFCVDINSLVTAVKERNNDTIVCLLLTYDSIFRVLSVDDVLHNKRLFLSVTLCIAQYVL